MKTATERRQRITRTPVGAPLAGPCRVRNLATGEYLRDEAAWPAARRDTPGHSIELTMGTRWAKADGGNIRINATQDDDPSGASNR